MIHRPSLPTMPPHIGPVEDDAAARERFALHELAIVMSHYELGEIERMRDCPLGSRRAPKLRIVAAEGEFFLKRRAPGRDDPHRVAFAHDMLGRLHARGYPVPALILTREGATMVHRKGRIYEMFEFVKGARYDRSLDQTARSGEQLGALHRLLDGYQPEHPAPIGSYHAVKELDARFERIVPAVAAAEPGVDRVAIARLSRHLQQAYREAAGQADAAGFPGWAPTIVHGDWHPGNLLFRAGAVVAALDFDSARREPRIADVANGTLQFSIRMADTDDPLEWPDGLDPDRMRAFIHGYHSEAHHQPLQDDELDALPWLMIEALIVESVVPIAATGSFGRIAGSRFLQMIHQKVSWLIPRAAKLARDVRQSPPSVG
jgi:Ser/Thr protein kinase RdoA (MazF antagonist)